MAAAPASKKMESLLLPHLDAAYNLARWLMRNEQDAKDVVQESYIQPWLLKIEIRSDLNDKIIQVIQQKGLTHAQVAKLAHTSRTRVTALVNRNTRDISTDLMLRILSALGVRAKIQFKMAA